MMTNSQLQRYFIFFFVTASNLLHSQSDKIDSLIQVLNLTQEILQKQNIYLHLSKHYERVDINKSKSYGLMALESENDSIVSEAYNQLGRANFYQNKLDSATINFNKSIELLNRLGYTSQAASVGISLGAVQLRKGDYQNAVSTFINGASYFEKVNDSINLAKCYSNVSTAFGELGDSKNAVFYGEKALEIFIINNMIPYQAITLPNLAGEYLKLGNINKAKNYFIKAEVLAKKRNDKFSLARIYNNLGNMYLEKDFDASEKYLTQALAIRQETNTNDGIAVLHNNLGFLYLNKNNPKKALVYLGEALKNGKGANLVTTYNNLSDAHEKLGNFREALKFLKMKNQLSDSILTVENQKVISEISTKYESEKKETEILNLQNANLLSDLKRRQNKNLMYTAFFLLLVGLALGYSYIKNARKKQIIAEQEQELEKQKVEKLLKEQELIGIDAMLEGQEKERLRISADLHDNLGGKLSALKLYIEDIKSSDKKLYNKIKIVLDETYNEVRNIAYQKNGSAMIEKGLIPAVNIVANRLKSTNKLNVEVMNIDLKKKVKNFIELQLFRIIQELFANTIKHANAKNVTIQFSEDENILNVVYEDDGKGFDIENTPCGLGLKNITNRIKKIGGTLNIDSNNNDGTTVILNVPL